MPFATNWAATTITHDIHNRDSSGSIIACIFRMLIKKLSVNCVSHRCAIRQFHPPIIKRPTRLATNNPPGFLPSRGQRYALNCRNLRQTIVCRSIGGRIGGLSGVPTGIRTPVTAVKGRPARPPAFTTIFTFHSVRGKTVR